MAEQAAPEAKANNLCDNPNADPKIVELLAPLGMDKQIPNPPIDDKAPLEAILGCLGAMEQMFASIPIGDLPPLENEVTESTEVIKGADDNDISLYISKPANAEGPLPAVIRIHGGGMAILSANGGWYPYFRKALASSGLILIGVEFRNSSGALGTYPFPAGLNDVASAAQWVNANREKLGISKVVLSGESGGGNLALATAIKAKKEGWVDQVDGIYAQVPFVSGTYSKPYPESLPSLPRNDGYFVTNALMALMARTYDPEGANAGDPTMWPLNATTEDLAGLPPTVIQTNELDPLLDEGKQMAVKLQKAGVSTTSITINGIPHAVEVTTPDHTVMFNANIARIKSFCDSL